MDDQEKIICHNCIKDDYVSELIKNTGEENTTCSYCNETTSTIEICSVADMMHKVFNDYYSSHYENEYYSFGATAEETIYEELGTDEEACSDIYLYLCNKHNDIDHEIYSDFYVYVKDAYEVTEFDFMWKKIKKSLETESRYFNNTLRKFLDEIFYGVEETFISSGATIRNLGPNDILFRARAFNDYDEIKSGLEHPERNFGPPPSTKARAGRMNAQGVPVFYGATCKETAIAEVRPAVGSTVVVCQFRPNRLMRVLDLSALEGIVIKEGSLFDPETRKNIEITSFLKTLSRKLTIPVSAARSDSEYLITQAVSEYLSISESLRLDGIMFHSTQSEHPSDGKDDKYNVVLFRKSSRVKNGSFNGIKYQVSLYENAEDDLYEPRPTIFALDAEKSNKTSDSALYRLFKKADLRMDISSIEVHTVKGVLYVTDSLPVDLKHIQHNER